MNGTPAPALSVHAGFIKTQLPAWLTRAPETVRKALRSSLIESNRSRHELKTFLNQLKNPADFARPLLKSSLKRKFRGLLNDETALLVREWKHHHLLGLIKTHARTTEHTLLDAALQNFETSEADNGGMEKGSALYTFIQGTRVRNPILPTWFAGLCRDLDIGRLYQAHLDQVLGPTYSLRMTSKVQKLFVEQAKNAFTVALHLAFMHNILSQAQYGCLLVLAQDGKHPDLTCSHLTLDNVVLPDVLVIEFRSDITLQLLYTPDDPLAPIRLHPSLDDLESKLAERLDTNPEYLAFFKRRVPLQRQETLLEIRPAWVDWISVGATGKHVPISLELTVSCTPIKVHLFLAITRRRIEQIKADGRELAVPTADIDVVSRQKRLQSYIDLGKSLLFFAASFVPIVGEVLLAVSAAQLLGTIYSGFAAWGRGDSDEALNDLMDVLDNVALAVATAGAVKTVGFTARLVKVKLRQGEERLWKPDLTPYRHLDKTLPGGVPADAQGLYLHDQQHYLKLDDHLHRVTHDPHSKQWQLQHPSDPHAHTPPLVSNGVGGWRMAHETSHDWDELKLIKRLGPDATNISQPQAETLLLVSGVDSTTLRQAHQEGLRPPPVLRDTLKRFNLDQEIQDFDIARAEGATVTPISPYIQMHLVCSLPEWPASRSVKVVDEQGTTLVSHGTGRTEIKVPLARFRKGELLFHLEEQMPSREFNELLPPSPAGYLSKVENLSQRLVTSAHQHRARLFAWLTLTLDTPVTAIEQQIGRFVPDASTSHLQEMAAVLSPEQQLTLQREKSLAPEQLWEADQYVQQTRASRARGSLHLDCAPTDDTPMMVLSTLSHMPGWPEGRRIEVRDKNTTGRVLGSSGAEDASPGYVVTREGEQYCLRDMQGKALHKPTDLLSAIAQTLSADELDDMLRPSGASSLRHAIRRTNLQVMARKRAAKRATLTRSASFPTGRTLDPLFAESTAPEGLSLRSDGIYQTPILPDGSYRYYVLENARHYQVQADSQGWRLVDARSRFRAYQPYIRKKPEGGWALEDSLVEHPGADLKSTPSSSEEFVSAESDNDYESADEGKTVYTARELRHMRSSKSFQHNQNYLRVFDRANNGRYPLRDIEGRPMRIRFIQSIGTSLRTGERFSKSLVMPFIQWEGFEKVAALYDDRLEVIPFTQAHQKFPEESSLLGQATVVTTRDIRKGEALGVYGGELLPYFVADNREDPYLFDVFVSNRKGQWGASTSKQLSPSLVLSGDNTLSRINTLFEYQEGQPVRQAKAGYNVVEAGFEVDTQVGTQPMVRLRLTAFFAAEDLAPGTELRWNYGYSEEAIRRLFGPAD